MKLKYEACLINMTQICLFPFILQYKANLLEAEKAVIY